MEFNNLASKGDFIKYCLIQDLRIKEIDSAIPLKISEELREFGINRSNLVTCYWGNGNIEILNIVEHATILYLRGV